MTQIDGWVLKRRIDNTETRLDKIETQLALLGQPAARPDGERPEHLTGAPRRAAR